MTITPQQIKQIHTLFSASGLKEQKGNIILGFSHGRGESSKDLTNQEAQELINYLQTLRQAQGDNPANKMRRKIISMAYEMGWAKPGNWKAAIASIDKFCNGPHGIFKKDLQAHSHIELTQVVTQFESMYKKHLNKV